MKLIDAIPTLNDPHYPRFFDDRTSRLPVTDIDSLSELSAHPYFEYLTDAYARQLVCDLAKQFSSPYYYGGDDTVYDYAPAAAEYMMLLTNTVASDDADLVYDLLVYLFTTAMPIDPARYENLRTAFNAYTCPIFLSAVDVSLSIRSVYDLSIENENFPTAPDFFETYPDINFGSDELNLTER